MSTLTTKNIKNVGQLQEKNEFAANDALLAWDAAGQKHVKLTYQKLNQTYSTIQSACETAQGAAEDAAAEAAGFAKGTGGGTYTNNNAEYFKTQAAAEALKSEGWAEGTENGTDVPSTSPYHEHNSKYWADQADASAGSAGTDALKAEGFAVGQQNGADVPSTSPYYENNAAYYADQASDSATAAAGSASDAEDWAEIARDAAAGALRNFFGTCATVAGTAAKDVAISEFSLYTGVKVQVKFTNGHTLTATKDANGVVTADYPTLNVSSTGAKAIKVGTEYAGENFVTAGDTHEFIYDGTYWVDLTAVNIYKNSTTARKRDGSIGLSGTEYFNIAHPIGSTYPQYPKQLSPNDLWGSISTWSKIDYGGVFFRTEGGKAKAFNSGTQTSQNKSHSHGMQYHTHGMSHKHYMQHTHDVDVPIDYYHFDPDGHSNFCPRVDSSKTTSGASRDWTDGPADSSGITINDTAGPSTNETSSEGGEEAWPNNQTYIIWKRTA